MNKLIYFTSLLTAIIYGTTTQLTGCLNGIIPAGGVEMFYCEYAAIAITLLFVFLAVRLFKQNIALRIALAEIALLTNITFWGIFSTKSFLYLCLISLVAFAFVFPKEEK